MATDLKGLLNFKKRVEKYTKPEWRVSIIEKILSYGRNIAIEEYQASGTHDYQIQTENNGLSGKIVAVGEQIAYIEFGTGAYANGSYKGKIPTENVPITGSWTYYYDSPNKVEINGKKGWFAPIEKSDQYGEDDSQYGVNFRFVVGQQAGNQMYNVSKRLREELPMILGVNVK